MDVLHRAEVGQMRLQVWDKFSFDGETLNFAVGVINTAPLKTVSPEQRSLQKNSEQDALSKEAQVF